MSIEEIKQQRRDQLERIASNDEAILYGIVYAWVSEIISPAVLKQSSIIKPLTSDECFLQFPKHCPIVIKRELNRYRRDDVWDYEFTVVYPNNTKRTYSARTYHGGLVAAFADALINAEKHYRRTFSEWLRVFFSFP